MTVDPSTLYTLYLDESGVGRPGNKDYEYFVFGGILVHKPDEQQLLDRLAAFKNKWQIDQEIPLHACEIRSKSDNFRFLESLPIPKVVEFKTDILEMVLDSALLLHGCVVHRQKYLARYEHVYGQKTWQLLKSAAIIAIERAARLVHARGGKLYVVFERGNTSSNNEIRAAYAELREQGAPFNPAASSKYEPMSPAQLSNVLFKRIEDKTKSNKLLQIADSCLLPLVEHKRTGNTAVIDKLRAANRLIDCVVEEPEKAGIKYYCFDT